MSRDQQPLKQNKKRESPKAGIRLRDQIRTKALQNSFNFKYFKYFVTLTLQCCDTKISRSDAF